MARELARNIDVPIEWVVTTGYGPSKRFLPGFVEAARLMDPPDSFIGLSSNADIDVRLAKRGIGNIHRYCEIHTQCELLSLPYARSTGWQRLRRILRLSSREGNYRARIRADDTSIHAPAGSTVHFNISVENKTNQTWDVGGSDYLRLGVLLKTTAGQIIRELDGAKLPPGTARPGGQDTVLLPVKLPQQRCGG